MWSEKKWKMSSLKNDVRKFSKCNKVETERENQGQMQILHFHRQNKQKLGRI